MKFDAFRQPQVPEVGEASFASFVAAMLGEFAEAVPASRRRGFYVAVGRRLAATETLDGVDDTAALVGRVNAFWQAKGWGRAEISLDRDAIIVHHRHPPAPPAGTPVGLWTGMLIAVLEGAYDSWFQRLGSGPTLHTSAEWKGDSVELRHGRQQA